MALSPGARLGVYEITGQIGAGGMGQVYRARDTKLNRDVALKVLPDAFADDPERLARFTREAQTLASLNHPHIAAIYGLEESGGVRALVMELVEGEDLSQLIERGAIPIHEALPIARQIAEALEAAHEHGIIHRDLKPANIMVRRDGTVKVLDFGLAKAMQPPADSSARLTEAQTLMPPVTQSGMILGTAAYMSPEQARGKPVDKRTDIWAFGAVLWEMLNATRLFAGESAAETLGLILSHEPDLATLPVGTPAYVRILIARCLVKDPRQRLRDIGDARLGLDGMFETTAPPLAGPTASSVGTLWMAIGGAALVAIVAMAVPVVRHLRETTPPAPPETRLDVVTPDTDNPASFAISPDGRRLVFVARDGGMSKLWLRPLDAVTARPISGTDGADYPPFWSPDGRSVGFVAGGAIKRIDLESGVVQPILTGPRNGAWSPGGDMLLGSALGPLLRVAAAGGQPVAATTLVDGQTQHWYPSFLPDGRRFLFYGAIGGAVETSGVFLGSLDSTGIARVVSNVKGSGAYVAPGWLLFVRQEALLSQPFDAITGKVSGSPVLVADGIGAADAVSVSTNGVIAYRPNVGTSLSQLTWFDRSGRVTGTFADPGNLVEPDLSPDDGAVLVGGNMLDGTRTNRVLPDRAGWPHWSPDGRRIVFSRIENGHLNLHVKPAANTSPDSDELLLDSPQNKVATAWSPDGRFLLFDSQDTRDGMDIWVLPLDGDRTPVVWLKSRAVERGAQFSPDGRFVAYQSNQSGRSEIYARPFLEPGRTPAEQWPISTAGGISPRWRADGREIYYISPDGSLMAVPITVAGATLGPGKPAALFQPRIRNGGTSANTDYEYDVARDGRILVNVVQTGLSPITIIQNWQAGHSVREP